MGNSSSNAEQKSLRKHVLRTKNNGTGRSAVIMGPTGATGKFIVSYLICSPEWSKITIIHRREVDLDEISKKSNITFTDEQKAKVTQHVVDMNKLCENEETINKNVELFKEHDITICVLGTKREIAKTAENFRKVDFYMVRDGAILSKKAGIQHFSLLSSKGSNANIWANDWKVTHGLLYLKTKGEAEQSVIEQKFERTSIFRPGVLGRDGERGGFMSKLSVRDLAAVMVYDAEGDEIKCIVDETKEEEPKNVESDKMDDAPKDDKADEAKPEDADKGKEEDVEEEEKKEDVVEKVSVKVEDVLFYEAGDIDNMLILARENFNAVCGGEMAESEDDKKVDDKVEDEEKEQEKEDKVESEKKEEPKLEEAAEEAAKEEEVNKESTDDVTPKYEVVEKPKEEEVTKTDEQQEELAKDDYVEVENDDKDKDQDKDQENGGDD